MNQDERDTLFDCNVNVLADMADGSRSAIKGLILELATKDIFIKLSNAEDHSIGYEIIEDNGQKFKMICGYLNYAVADGRINIPH